MAIYAIGDLHLSMDDRIEKPMDVFGKSWADHDVRLKENWTDTVSDEDIVIICGDISWGLKLDEAMADLNFIEGLPGKKIITKGNHDLWWVSIGRLNAISENLIFLQNTAFVTEDGIGICGTRGWICPGTDGFDSHDQKIYNRELMRLEMSIEDALKKGARELIGVLHYPPSNDKFQPSGFTEIMSKCGVKTCVYGHLHGKEAFKHGYKGNWNGVEYKLVSLDYVNATPLKISE